MGTLGCINDMMRRDKENRELRKLNRDRIKEHQKYLVEKGKGLDLSNISAEKLDEIRKKTIEKEELDKANTFKIKLIILISALFVFLLCWLIYQCFF
ncbi:hypothetical protein [Bacteroides cellulosilyticus]|uniref:hypothetical protein n=1 Tax=Bacteroides cellulosilyticus TaxID=246787 RepID=UPI0032ED33AF